MKDCGIKISRSLKTKFTKHYHRMKKLLKLDNFLYKHFKNINHSPNHISIQNVENILYDDNSTKRYWNVLRHI